MKYNKREWQLYEKGILDKVVAICEKHQIQYYLSSGTLLGAVRHKGFIPWDDDIDIDMPIRDYKKFCKVARKELEEVGLFLQTYHTDPEFNAMWAMVRANNTTSMPIKDTHWNIHWGIHIDIFPLIGLYKNSFIRKMQTVLFDFNLTLLERDYYLSGSMKDYKVSNKIKLLYKLPRKLLHMIVDINNIFIDVPFNHSEEGSIKWISLQPKYRYEFYKNNKTIEFEGCYYYVPDNYDGELTLLYGDYMTLPPESERDGHEGFMGDIIRDLTRDYKEYKK